MQQTPCGTHRVTRRKGLAAIVRFYRRLASAPVRRGALALLLAGVVLFPEAAARFGAGNCRDGGQSPCPAHRIVRWSRPLAGSWVALPGVEGTVPSQGQAYVAIGHGIAVVGTGLTLRAYDARTGAVRWTTTLTGLASGASIESVRAWPGAVTVGVAGGLVGRDEPERAEVLLDARNGRRIRTYLAASSGGAVSAGRRRTVIVGPKAVTSYSSKTGKARWRVPTGLAPQAWRVDGRELYVTVSAEGVVGTAPVTAVRQIGLHHGAERLIQPRGGSFDGRLVAVLDGVLVFSGPDGLSMYRVLTGRLTGQRAGAVFEGIDPIQHVLYVDVAGGQVGIDPVTGQNEPGTRVPGPPGTYGVLGGVALGLDSGAAGKAWGYSIAKRRVSWTTGPLPWPHYFVDLSGLGGSVDPGSGLVLLATCAKTGQAVPDGSLAGSDGQACLRARLVAIGP